MFGFIRLDYIISITAIIYIKKEAAKMTAPPF